MAYASPHAQEEDRLSILEGKVEDLTRSLAAFERRLVRLEGHEAAAGAPPAAVRPAAAAGGAEPEEVLPAPSASDMARLLGLTGRTLLAFGGAYLLRAVTAAGYLPEAAGVVVAFAYALVWLFLADRAGAKGAALSAAFHGATAVLIGLPLLWETTTRFDYLEPAAAGLGVALFAAATLAVAWRRNLQGLAWILALGLPATAIVLLASTHAPAPFGLDLVLLGVAGLGLYYGRGWHALGWWMGLMGHLGGLLVAFGALAQQKGEAAALGVGLLLALAFLASLAVQTLVRGREAGVFEAVQTGLAVAVGYGGAALVAGRLMGWAVALAGALGLLLAAGAYGAAFQLVPRARRAKLLLFSTLALAFTLAGSALLLPAPARAAAWAGLAVLAGWQGVRQRRVTLSLHGAFYSLAAAAASGLLAAAAYAFAAPPGTAWPPLSAGAWFALAAAAVVCALPVPRPAAFWKPYEGLTRSLQIAVFLWGAAGAVLHLLAPALALGQVEGADPGLLATARTAVLTAVALLLGAAARWERFREAAWLVYPALLLAALKLLVEDFPHGRPATLFVALALCGLAFLFAPRLARRAA